MDFIFVDKREETSEPIRNLLECSEIGLDVETSSLDPFTATFLLLQLEINDKIYVFDVRKLGLDFIKYLISLIIDSNKLVIGHNIKFDNKILYVNTGELIKNIHDIMLAEILINQGIGKQFYSLEEIVYKYFLVKLDKSERSSFEGYAESYFTNDQITYSALDVRYLREIKDKQLKILENQKQLKVLELENKLNSKVGKLELSGVLIDNDKWNSLISIAKDESQIFELSILDLIISKLKVNNYENCLLAVDAIKIPAKTKKLRSELELIKDISYIETYLRENLNINSYTQMLEILRLLVDKNLSSTSEKIIKDYRHKSELIDLILSYREHQKKLTTYGENFFELINPATGRIHIDHEQLGTRSGRFAVSRLHQIPRENKYRNAFIARKGYKILTADYDQEELRLLAWDSQEPVMIEAFLNGKDIHKVTASILYNKPIEDISKNERYWGKTLNFATVYGTTEYGLLYNFGLPLDTGKEFLKKYFKGYNTLKFYLESLGEKIWEMGYCPTMYGRRRYFEKKDIFKDHYDMFKYKSKVIRELRNHRIQGSGGDIIKLAIIDIDDNNIYGDKLRLLTQVHDELVYEVEENIDAKEFINYYMVKAEQPFLGEIPASVGITINDCWSKD